MARVFLVAIVHPIGEDNDSTFSVVAPNRAKLDARVLEACKDWTDGELTADQLNDEFDVQIDEHGFADIEEE